MITILLPKWIINIPWKIRTAFKVYGMERCGQCWRAAVVEILGDLGTAAQCEKHFGWRPGGEEDWHPAGDPGDVDFYFLPAAPARLFIVTKFKYPHRTHREAI